MGLAVAHQESEFVVHPNAMRTIELAVQGVRFRAVSALASPNSDCIV